MMSHSEHIWQYRLQMSVPSSASKIFKIYVSNCFHHKPSTGDRANLRKHMKLVIFKAVKLLNRGLHAGIAPSPADVGIRSPFGDVNLQNVSTYQWCQLLRDQSSRSKVAVCNSVCVFKKCDLLGKQMNKPKQTNQPKQTNKQTTLKCLDPFCWSSFSSIHPHPWLQHEWPRSRPWSTPRANFSRPNGQIWSNLKMILNMYSMIMIYNDNKSIYRIICMSQEDLIMSLLKVVVLALFRATNLPSSGPSFQHRSTAFC